MKIAIPKPVYVDMAKDLSASPFGIRENDFRYDSTFEMELGRYAIADLRQLYGIFTRCTIRGAKTLARDVATWIKATTKNESAPCARKTSQGASLLKVFLSRYPKHHVFSMNVENDETAVLCFYVERITYHARNDRNDTPEHIVISLAYSLFGRKEKKQEVLYYSDVIGKNPEEMLSRAGLYAETPELRAAYTESFHRYEELHAQVGLQVDATGYADTKDIDEKGGSRWSIERWELGKNGEPSRLVVDCFRETDKKNSQSDVHVYSDFWNLRIKWINGEAEMNDDEEEDADIDLAMEIPVHPYLVCFDLRKHRRMRVHVSSVTEYVYDTEARDSLSLPVAHGALIDTLLTDRVSAFKDIVKNKSGGTVVLLQGSPGTGKTLTAEIYAESLQRPLYSVQCSQLGIKIDEVEENLMTALARGRRWNAVMLLDESDVYVSQRGNDLVQNAIVGVFLRVLEYHAGVLFLTTNRGDQVDDAILSRCTARIVYTIPSAESQKRIWGSLCASNGVKIKMAVIKDIVEKHPMSGRDIKNVLKLCVAVGEDQGKPIDAALVGYVKQFKPTSTEGEAS